VFERERRHWRIYVKAFRLLEAERPPMLVDVPKPKAGSRQVVNKVDGAGLCHTDLALMHRKKALHALALGIERIGLVSLRFPMAVAVVVIALAIACGFGVARIKVDDSLSQLFRSYTPEFKQYEEVTRPLEPDCPRRSSHPCIREIAPAARDPPPQRGE
jgi:hypothetical protein